MKGRPTAPDCLPPTVCGRHCLQSASARSEAAPYSVKREAKRHLPDMREAKRHLPNMQGSEAAPCFHSPGWYNPAR